MALSIRPVVETWGEHLTVLSREVSMAQMLIGIAGQVPEAVLAHETEYGDFTIAYISRGAAFLNFLETSDPVIVFTNLDIDIEDGREAERVVSDIRDMRALVPEWRKFLDPGDGSLRFYCDNS